MDMSVETKTEGLGGETTKQEVASVTGGVPKPVKKTFAEVMTKQELEQRMKGSALQHQCLAAPDAALWLARLNSSKPQERITLAIQFFLEARFHRSLPGHGAQSQQVIV